MLAVDAFEIIRREYLGVLEQSEARHDDCDVRRSSSRRRCECSDLPGSRFGDGWLAFSDDFY